MFRSVRIIQRERAADEQSVCSEFRNGQHAKRARAGCSANTMLDPSGCGDATVPFEFERASNEHSADLGRIALTKRLIGLAAAAMAASAGLAAAQPGTPSPAFTAEQLVELPTEMWATFAGNLANQRYSPLDQIDTSNVANLKAVWRTGLGGSGVTPRASNQGEPLYYDGVLYVTTSDNDVFAIDVDSGDIIWSYYANLPVERRAACCGWASRGVGMGAGKIFVGRQDAMLVALDQTTGKVAWEEQIADPAERYSITSAPRYFDGLVYIGTSGRRIPAPFIKARCAPATTCSLRRSSRSTRRPANTDGTSSSSITTSGTTTRRIRRCCSTSRSTGSCAAASRTRAKPVGSTCWTVRTARR